MFSRIQWRAFFLNCFQKCLDDKTIWITKSLCSQELSWRLLPQRPPNCLRWPSESVPLRILWSQTDPKMQRQSWAKRLLHLRFQIWLQFRPRWAYKYFQFGRDFHRGKPFVPRIYRWVMEKCLSGHWDPRWFYRLLLIVPWWLWEYARWTESYLN